MVSQLVEGAAMMGARAPPASLSVHTVGAEQKVRASTHELDKTPSLELRGAAGLSVGPRDHLHQDHLVCLLKCTSLGPQLRPPAFL